MVASASERFEAALSLIDTPQPIPLPKSFEVEVDLIYPQGYHLNKEAMVDHLLRNSSTFQTAPFILVQETERNLDSEDLSIIHKKIKYELEPQLPGKYALTLFEISFLSDDLKAEKNVDVVSPIVYVDIELFKAPAINLVAEAAPLSSLSERVPIELTKEIRVHLSQDQANHNVEMFKKKELPWNLAIGVIFVSLLLVGTWLLFNYLKKNKPISQPVPKKNPLVEAEKLLDKLKKQSVLDHTTVEMFINELIASSRDYLEQYYQIPASSLSTQEFLEKVKIDQKLNQDQKVAIEELFQLADQIKFGGYKPSLEECKLAMSRRYGLS